MTIFNKLKNSLVEHLLSLSRSAKTSIACSIDYLLLTLSFWISLSIRINDFFIPTSQTLYLIILAPLLGLPVLYSFGLYRSVIRYSSYRSTITIIFAISILTESFLYVIKGIIMFIILSSYFILNSLKQIDQKQK